MGAIHGGELAVRALERQGVRVVFSVSGGAINPLYHALRDSPIRLIHARHEAAATFMADGWARLTREPGVCLLTLGGGVATATVGIVQSFLAATPIVALGGRFGLAQQDMRPFSEFDQVGLMRSVTKWARTVYETARIPEYVAAAFRHARRGRPGPVFLDVPRDIIGRTVEEAPPVESAPPEAPPLGDPAAVERAAALLREAERPVCLVGSGVWWAAAHAELRTLVETLGIPTFAERMGRGSLAADHPLNFGPGAVSVNGTLAHALHHADLLFLVGTRLDYLIEYARPPLVHPAAKAIQVDIEPEEIGHNRPIDAGIVGDARQVLRQLAGALAGARPDRTAAWRRTLDELRRLRAEQLRPLTTAAGSPIHPARLCREIREIAGPGAVLISSGGDIEQWGRMLFEPHHPGHYVRQGQFGCLGVDVPYGIAAKLAHPDKPVVVLTGDGGFGYHAMELDTAARYGLPIVVVIGNDGLWAQIKHQYDMTYPGPPIGMDLAPRRYEQMAEALGGRGERIEEADDFRPALERALASDRPTVLNVAIPSAMSPETIWGYKWRSLPPEAWVRLANIGKLPGEA